LGTVENSDRNQFVKIGFGKKEHSGVLMTAGAEKVFFAPDEKDLVIERGGLREGDTLLVAHPPVMSVADYKRAKEACAGDLLFQVVGADPVQLETDADFTDFRKKKARVGDVPIVPSTGRPARIKHTVEQADAIIRLWHEVPKRKPEEIIQLTDTILGLPEGTTKKSWVRDLVRKYVGTAQREKPAVWRGVRID
jgi:hypothetical protein